jgi:thiamine kinase
MSPPAEALALVPGLEQGAAPLLLARLAGGHVNETWRVDTTLGQFTLRLDGPVAMRPGVDRSRELQLHGVAAAAGLAPRIVRAAPAAQALVCEFLPGRTWADADFQDPIAIARLGERLALLHQLAPPALAGQCFDPHALAVQYLQQAIDTSTGAGTGALSRERDAVLRQLRQALAGIEAAATPPVMVHGDLPYGNVLENSQLWLLDWEYAQLADPIYDVACIVAHLPLTAALRQRLLAAAGLGAAADAGRLPAAAFVYRVLTWAWHLARAERCAAPTFA